MCGICASGSRSPRSSSHQTLCARFERDSTKKRGLEVGERRVGSSEEGREGGELGRCIERGRLWKAEPTLPLDRGFESFSEKRDSNIRSRPRFPNQFFFFFDNEIFQGFDLS